MIDKSFKDHSVASVVTAASFGFVVVQLDVTIVNVALPAIARSLGAGISELQWVVDAYSLVFAVLLLTAGVVGDHFGSRRAYLAGFWVFALASLGCGLSTDATTLIIARALQGIGAALLVPSSLSILNHASGHDRALRARMVGLWTAAGGVSIAAGPIVGGLLLGWFGWRTIFLVNLPICAFAMILTMKVTPKAEVPERQRSLDPVGQVLAILALTGLVGAVIEARPLGLTHPLVLGGFAMAVLSGIGFIMVEHRSKAPMLPLEFFSRPNFTPATLFGIVANMTYYGVIFVLSLYLQQVKGWSPAISGLAFLPLTGGFIISNMISGAVVARWGSRPPMVIGGLIGAIGFALLATLNEHSNYLAMLAPFILIPGGMGLGVPAMTTAILGSVERQSSGVASAVLNTARQAAGAIGVALFGALAGGDQIVSGLRLSAMISVVLVLFGAVLAAVGMHAHKAEGAQKA
ncbi:MFS transporter [Neorhizobium sp. P12A]|jgi:DHA2 family methylenomycin A resistance protein-like MFS transporter|uniref:MFS transporter n=1 Tax=Neorhizobium sp. P12A TaxID=2268027 RepID=UPI0011ED8157|nr:MFS transporter [Neorhizobium sp. P12A]KAA0700660.1 MFS transporter [Neorhizobium sp. P12A]